MKTQPSSASQRQMPARIKVIKGMSIPGAAQRGDTGEAVPVLRSGKQVWYSVRWDREGIIFKFIHSGDVEVIDDAQTVERSMPVLR